jgi:heme-degrading monooxygenase HmoA
MSDAQPMAPFTVVATLTLQSGNEKTFTDAVTAQLEFMSARPGFVHGALSRSLRQPARYVAVSLWQDASAYHRVVSSPEFTNYIFGVLGYLAEGESERGEVVTESAWRDGKDASVLAVADFTLREDASTEDFEAAFGKHATFVRGRDGFVSHRLTRLQLDRKRSYVNLGWWRDADAYLAVVQSPEFAADASAMGRLAKADADLYRITATFAPGR